MIGLFYQVGLCKYTQLNEKMLDFIKESLLYL